MPRQIKRLVKASLGWPCPHCALYLKRVSEVETHIRHQHTSENVGKDYEWLLEGSDERYLHKANTCFVKVKEPDTEAPVPRSFVVSSRQFYGTPWAVFDTFALLSYSTQTSVTSVQ